MDGQTRSAYLTRSLAVSDCQSMAHRDFLEAHDSVTAVDYMCTQLECVCGAIHEIGASGPQEGTTPNCKCGLKLTAPGDHCVNPDVVVLRRGNRDVNTIREPDVAWGHTKLLELNLEPDGDQQYHVRRHFWVSENQYCTFSFCQRSGSEELVTWLMRHWWVWKLELASFRYVFQESFAVINGWFVAGAPPLERFVTLGCTLNAALLNYFTDNGSIWGRPFDADGVTGRVFQLGSPSRIPIPPIWSRNDESFAVAVQNMASWIALVNDVTTTVDSPLFRHNMSQHRLGRLRCESHWPDIVLERNHRFILNAMRGPLSSVRVPSGIRFPGARPALILWLKTRAYYEWDWRSSPQWGGTMASIGALNIT